MLKMIILTNNADSNCHSNKINRNDNNANDHDNYNSTTGNNNDRSKIIGIDQ